MKKLIERVSAAALTLASAGYVWAVDAGDIDALEPRTDDPSVAAIIVAIINFILAAAGALAVLFLIIGGVRYIIAAGNEDQVEGARHTIFNAIVGIIVIILALVVVNVINNQFGQEG